MGQRLSADCTQESATRRLNTFRGMVDGLLDDEDSLILRYVPIELVRAGSLEMYLDTMLRAPDAGTSGVCLATIAVSSMVDMMSVTVYGVSRDDVYIKPGLFAVRPGRAGNVSFMPTEPGNNHKLYRPGEVKGYEANGYSAELWAAGHSVVRPTDRFGVPFDREITCAPWDVFYFIRNALTRIREAQGSS